MRQHFLPAAYIGRFSLDSAGRARERTIWVGRDDRKPHRARAGKVARQAGLYDSNSLDVTPSSIDSGWRYEGRLTQGLDTLSDATAPLAGSVWAQTLVPFVSSLFIRGIDFAERYAQRIPGITGPGTGAGALDIDWHDTTIGARSLEWQRLLAPVMAAEWTVFHGSGDPLLPTNDIGYCLMTPPDRTVDWSYAIPLDSHTVLALTRRPVRAILQWTETGWMAPVEHREIDDSELLSAGRAIHATAYRESYGPTADSVGLTANNGRALVRPAGAQYLLHSSGRGLVPYQEDYFRVLSLLENTFHQVETDGADVDWAIVAKHWASPILIELNLPCYPGGLALSDTAVILDMNRIGIEQVEADLEAYFADAERGANNRE